MTTRLESVRISPAARKRMDLANVESPSRDAAASVDRLATATTERKNRTGILRLSLPSDPADRFGAFSAESARATAVADFLHFERASYLTTPSHVSEHSATRNSMRRRICKCRNESLRTFYRQHYNIREEEESTTIQKTFHRSLKAAKSVGVQRPLRNAHVTHND